MLEIGINLAATLKTLMGCLTIVYIIHTVANLFRDPAYNKSLNTLGNLTRGALLPKNPKKEIQNDK